MGIKKHRSEALSGINCAVITVSDSRGAENDPSGDLIAKRLERAEHHVERRLWVRDETDQIESALDKVHDCQLIVLTGGTGTTDRDVTWRTVESYCAEPLPAFAALFTQLSYDEVGPAAMLSRACAGICRNPNRVVFALPGSAKACALAMEQLIIPEAGHLLKHLQR